MILYTIFQMKQRPLSHCLSFLLYFYILSHYCYLYSQYTFVFIHVSPFQYSSFLPEFSCFVLSSFSFYLKNILCYFLQVHWWNFLSICFCLFFFFFHATEVDGYSLSKWCAIHCLLLSTLFKGTLAIILLKVMFFFSCCFEDFSFCLCFSPVLQLYVQVWFSLLLSCLSS